MCGTNGEKFPQIREHMQRCIGDAYPNSGYDLSFDNFPNGPERDPTAYVPLHLCLAVTWAPFCDPLIYALSGLLQ